MGREGLSKSNKKADNKNAPIHKVIRKDKISHKVNKKAEAEAEKMARRKEHKEKIKKQEHRQEAVEEEELKIEKELFDKNGYFAGPTNESVFCARIYMKYRKT